MTARSLAATVLRLMPLQLIGRGGEALLPALLAAWFGRSAATDVYWFCWACFSFAGALVFAASQDSALVAIVAEQRANAPARLPELLGALVGNTLRYGGMAAAAVGVAMAAWLWVRYDGAERALALQLVAPLTLGLVTLSLRTCFCAVLNAEHAFTVAPLASALGMATTLGAIALLRGVLDVAAIPLASLGGEVVALIVLATALERRGLWARPTLARPPALLRFRRLVLSEMAGNGVVRINPIVDQWVAGLAGIVGGGTIMRYSCDLSLFPTSVLQATLLSILMARLSSHAARGQRDELVRTLRQTLLVVAGLLIAATAVVCFLREPLARIAFGNGAMDAQAVAAIAALVPWFAVGLAPFGVLLLLARAHVALQNSRIMFSMGIINAVLNLGGDLLLVGPLGLRGVALSTSITHTVIAGVFWWRLQPLLSERR